MIFLQDSFTVVLLGDWNKLYIQPNWIAENVYKNSQIEIGVTGQGTDFGVSYRHNGVLIAPSQSQMMFTATNMSNQTIDYITECVNAFLQKATTPVLTAYGYNCDYYESDDSLFADVVDNMADNSSIIANGYEINDVKVSRSLCKDGKILNMETSFDGNHLRIHFNEHHGDVLSTMPEISSGEFKEFLKNTQDLVEAFGYEMEVAES